jgi:hypothetical protein
LKKRKIKVRKYLMNRVVFIEKYIKEKYEKYAMKSVVF